jgi:catechol 2,3-dioxygenase-like lactoylglutathione lyase family enzyme
MDLNHLHLMVKDIKRSQAFYEAMFGFTEKIWYGDNLLFLQNAHGFDLALTGTPQPQPLPQGVHYGFSISDRKQLDEMYSRGKDLFPDCFKTPPKDHGDWGTLLCMDLDGYPFEIYWDQNLRPTK